MNSAPTSTSSKASGKRRDGSPGYASPTARASFANASPDDPRRHGGRPTTVPRDARTLPGRPGDESRVRNVVDGPANRRDVRAASTPPEEQRMNAAAAIARAQVRRWMDARGVSQETLAAHLGRRQ